MPFPFSNIEEDPFDPYAEEPEPPWGLQPDEADIADMNMQTDMYSSYGNPNREGSPQPIDPAWYERGMLDAPEYWNNPSIMGQGIGRPELQKDWTLPPGTQQEVGLTPPYGTRREPVTNPITQDRRHVDQFIDDTDQREEYANMPEVARDVNEQGDMIRGAAPRMRTREIMRLLEEQMNGQGFMLPPPMEDYIQPEDEEEVFRGRRFG